MVFNEEMFRMNKKIKIDLLMHMLWQNIILTLPKLKILHDHAEKIGQDWDGIGVENDAKSLVYLYWKSEVQSRERCSMMLMMMRNVSEPC